MKKRIVAHFDIPGMTAEQYDRVLTDLRAAGQIAPTARSYHVAAPKPGGWMVTDVWDSQEDLDQFAGVLMPILIRNGVTPPPPSVYAVHNVM
jgi:hypothetical protein